jgi:hypothetical protein
MDTDFLDIDDTRKLWIIPVKLFLRIITD